VIVQSEQLLAGFFVAGRNAWRCKSWSGLISTEKERQNIPPPDGKW
jgi:hypothetical protein